MTSRFSTALYKCKLNDCDAVNLLTAFFDSVSLNSTKYIINQTSIKTSRPLFGKENVESKVGFFKFGS